jgi:NADPH2:quinone reductase
MMFRVAEVRPDQAVLIHGASGAVGTALAQLGRMAGLRMYGTASTAKQQYLRDMKVTPIDYRTEDFVQRIRNETGGNGVDVVFDAISVDNFARSYSVLRPGGLLVEYGLYLKARDEHGTAGLIGEFLSWQWQQLMWNWFPEQERRFAFYSISDMRNEHPQWFRNDLATLFGLAIEGTVAPRIWKRIPLADAALAHRHIEAGDVQGKIVLSVSTDDTPAGAENR